MKMDEHIINIVKLLSRVKGFKSPNPKIAKLQNSIFKMNNVEINESMRLSEHFLLGEVCKTSHKTKDGNIPSRVI